ncbi:hypothetical protein BKA63DRAFT_414993, partial [Paraphoma chrysanthemicola]
MWRTVSCQKFHNTNKLGRLFQVGGEAAGPRAANDADADVSQAIEMSLTQAMTRLEDAEKEKRAAIEADTDRYDFNEWLNRAGWARHLQGLKRDWLLAMVVKPTHKERALFDVCWAVRMVIWRAQQASKSSVVGMPAMMYINRREFGNHTNEKPLNAQQIGKTMVKYSDVWLMLALLDHVLGDNEYTSALISGLAVLGISGGSGWLSPLIYTPKLSAVVSTSRMLVLYQSTQMRQEKMDTLAEEEGWGPEDAAAMAPSHHQLVQEMANRFMTLTEYGGKPTPMDTILRLRAFGFKIRFTTNAEGVIGWVGDTLLYSNIQFSMPQLRSMIHGMIASARHQILNELMLLQVDNEGVVAKSTTALPVIDWGRLVDNAAEQRVGWSFMEDPRNRNATSLVTVKHQNSANGDSRGIFIEDGAVVFVTKYHKNVGQTGK